MSDLSDWHREHVQAILKGSGTDFGSQLIRLIAKADVENREKLRKAFPEAVQSYEDWYYYSRSGDVI